MDALLFNVMVYTVIPPAFEGEELGCIVGSGERGTQSGS